MIRCVIYSRVSSEEQAAEGKTSIQTQLDDCRALAAKLGWVIVGEFVDDRRYRVGKRLVEPSGTRADRPQWRRMLDMLSQGRADALVAWHSSRLYRGYHPMADFLEIIEARPVQVQLVKDSFDPRFAVLQAWLGKEENRARIERTYFGHAGRARKGFSATRTSAFFKAVRDPDTGAALGYEFDEIYRAAFDAMARMFLQKLSYREIAKQLGTNPRTGRRWDYKSVADMLANPFYRGIIDYGRRSHKGIPRFQAPGRHKPVWDEATCRAIDGELARRQVVGAHAPRSKLSPFAGVLRCGYCGWSMSPTHSSDRRTADGRPYIFYHCHHNRLVMRGYEPGTPHVPNGISESKLLRLIRAQFDGLDESDVDLVVGLLASQLPGQPLDDSSTVANLAEAEHQIAELEPELKRVKTPAARAAIDGLLSDLRQQAALYRDHLAVRLAPSTINLEDMRLAMLELVANPALLDQPAPELKIFVNRCFPVLHIASGQFVPKPGI